MLSQITIKIYVLIDALVWVDAVLVLNECPRPFLHHHGLLHPCMWNDAVDHPPTVQAWQTGPKKYSGILKL